MFGCTRCPTGHGTCPRCSTRICMEHVPFGGDACAECELAYHESRGDLKMSLWFLVGFALPWIFFAGIYEHLPSWSARSGGARAITTGVPMLDVIIMFTVVAVFAGKAAMGLRVAHHRRAFITTTAT